MFLLQTAILDQMTSSLCDALTGKNDSQGMREMLEHANLFILPLDENRQWYRYHQLFADLLRHHLKQTQSERLPILYSRASYWYEQNGFIEQAIEHALRCADFDRAGSLIEEHVDGMWEGGEHTKLRQLLASLPDETILTKPHLCVIRAWDLFTSGRHDAAERCLRDAEQALEAKADRRTETAPMERRRAGDSGEMNIPERIATIRAYLALYKGDVDATVHFALLALERLPEGGFKLARHRQHRFRGRIRFPGRDSHGVSGTKKNAGGEQQLDLAQEIGMSQTVVAGWFSATRGEVLAELNEPDRAFECASDGVEPAERGQDVMVIGRTNLCLLRVLFSGGDIKGADRVIKKMENTARKHDVPPFITNPMNAWRVRVLLAQDKTTAAAQWVKDSDLEIDGGSIRFHEGEYVALARVLIAQERRDESAVLLQLLLEQTEKKEHTTRLIEILMLQALTLQGEGDTNRAISVLERALALAEPAGYIRIFVDEGPPMAHLLYETLTRGISPEYVRLLLAVFPTAEPEKTGTVQTQTPDLDLIEPLSKRELEVLHLIAEGLPNQEIGTKLFVSLNTAKAHTRNIYGKLGIHNRTQAVAKARALGILPLASRKKPELL